MNKKIFNRHKKKKVILVIVLLVIGVSSIYRIYRTNQYNPINQKEEINYKNKLTGMREWIVEVETERVDYLDGIKWNDKYVKEVTVDDSKVKLSEIGEYELIYNIIPLSKEDETLEITQKVTVKVVSKEEAESGVSEGIEVVTKANGIQNKVEIIEPTEEDVKTDLGNSVPDQDNSSSGGNVNNPVEEPTTPPVETPVTPPTEEPVVPPVTPPSSGGNQAPSTPSHIHTWEPVYRTVSHPEQGHNETVVIKDAWVETKPKYDWQPRIICNICGEDITDHMVATGGDYMFHVKQSHPGQISWREEWRDILVGEETIEHPAVTEERYVVDKPAWSEQVLDHYRCNCGATK